MFGNARNAAGVLSGLIKAREVFKGSGLSEKLGKFGSDGRTKLDRAAERTEKDEQARQAYYRELALQKFRDMGQEQWMAMDPKELGANIREYRAHLLDQAFDGHVAGADRNAPESRNARNSIASMRKVNENPERFPHLSDTSIGLSKNMSSNRLFGEEDGKMMGNLTELLQHRARQQQRSSQKGSQR